MRKIAVMVLLSMLFVSALQGVSFAGLVDPGGAVGAVGKVEIYKPRPDGGYEKTTKTTIEPSTSGAKTGAKAGAVGGATAGFCIAGPVGAAVGAGVGAVVGAIGGWIFGPAD